MCAIVEGDEKVEIEGVFGPILMQGKSLVAGNVQQWNTMRKGF